MVAKLGLVGYAPLVEVRQWEAVRYSRSLSVATAVEEQAA